MPIHFADKLIGEIEKKGTPICVGLDPRIEQIPPSILVPIVEEKGRSYEAVAGAFIEFNKGIIDAVHDLVPAVKPQFAFYLQYGFSGVFAFEQTCKYAVEKGLIVIADAKSNDVGSTAEAYARSFLGKVDVFDHEIESPFFCDALTVNGYLGYDGIKPFIDVCKEEGKGIFVLVKTSNPSSGDLQDQEVCEKKIPAYELVGQFVDSWGSDEIGERGYSSVGAVVGATYPKQAAQLRKLMPNSIFLVPGFGAQGGRAEDVKPCFNSDGLGAIVNSSRGIIFAWEKEKDEKKYKEAAREAVEIMKKDLSSV